MFIPAYKLTIGSKVIDTVNQPQASTVTDLKVELDLDTPADSVTLVMGQVGFQPALNDEMTIELGYADGDELIQVMTGTLIRLEPGLVTKRAIGYSPANLLLHTFVNQMYENKTAGQIVRDLAERTEIEISKIQDGILFPAYVVDSQRNIYYFMNDLAKLCGFDLYINAAGELIFEKFTNGKTLHTFEYTKHILELEIVKIPPSIDQVQAWGESPAGQGGAEAWAWLTRNFTQASGKAGSGNNTFLLERSVLRTAEAAQTAADAALHRLQKRCLRGQVLALGQPQVKLGDAIQFSGLPDDSLNQIFQVRRVCHRITKQWGFTTCIGFQSLVQSLG